MSASFIAITSCVALLLVVLFLSAQAQFLGGGGCRRNYQIRNPETIKEQEAMEKSLAPGFQEDVFTFARLSFGADQGCRFGGGRTWGDDTPELAVDSKRRSRPRQFSPNSHRWLYPSQCRAAGFIFHPGRPADAARVRFICRVTEGWPVHPVFHANVNKAAEQVHDIHEYFDETSVEPDESLMPDAAPYNLEDRRGLPPSSGNFIGNIRQWPQ
jgi:hypothetical protein